MLRISKWSGVVSSASPYILPAGGAVHQVNAMSMIPGQLTVRGGMGKPKGFTVIGDAKGDEIWGYTAGGYATPLVFGSTNPAVFSQGRRGEVYKYDGNGLGQVWSPSLKTWRNVGLSPPSAAPSVKINTTPTYYVARIDIEDQGGGYNKPPTVTIGSPSGINSKQAKAIARISRGSLSEIDVTEYGKGYTKTPCVTINDTDSTGTGAKATIVLEDGSAPGNPASGIVYWEIIQAGKIHPCWPAGSASGNGKDFAATLSATGGSGSGAKVRITLQSGSSTDACQTDAAIAPSTATYAVQVDSLGQGYGPKDEVTVTVPFATSGNSVVGFGYSSFTPTNCGSGCSMVIKGYAKDHPNCPPISEVNAANTYRARKIKQVAVTAPGTMYLSAPSCKFLPYPNAPDSTAISIDAETDCSGGIKSISTPDENKYLIPPVYDTDNVGKAKALAIVRATLRGKYQCYYRFVNDTVPEEEGGPIYSNLSPVTEVDAGDGASVLTWSPASSGGTAVELWRSTSNQATTLFRVAKLGGKDAFGSVEDDLTDWELTDPDRKGFLALPILLPNGELNANRFGVPPSNFSSAVLFQDRMWMAVDTGGKEGNVLRFSEGDEPESMPDVNELIIQSNLRSTDYITALIPYAGAMIVCQSRHSHRLTYVSQPLIDAALFLLAYRGCFNQRCWDIYDGRMYAMDDQGVYSLDPQGNVESLTLGIDDIWRGRLDMSVADRFIVRADRRLNVLRVSVAFEGDGADKYPTRQLVYSFDYKSWWEERYPVELKGGTEVRTDSGRIALAYSTEKGIYELSDGLTDFADGAIQSVKIVAKGRGYRQPPKITAVGGHGAEFEAGINTDGEITGITIKYPGTQYAAGNLVIEPPPQGGAPAAASYTITGGEIPIHWSFKSGAFEYVNDSQDKRGGEQQSRHCSVTYQPTAKKCLLELKAFYNNAKYPRSNVVRRDRGTGFVHSDEIPAAVLDMQSTPLQEAESHGVARALFAGRVLDDMMGSDRHVSVELSGKQDNAGPVSIHVIDIFGVNEKQGGD